MLCVLCFSFAFMDETCLVPGNRRGGTVLLDKGFRYRRRNKAKNKIYWQCCVTDCGAYLHTNKFFADDVMILIDEIRGI